MREERARHANSSTSSFQPKQNPQQTETCAEAEAAEGGWLDGGPRAGASGSFWGLGYPHQRWGGVGEAPLVIRACLALHPQGLQAPGGRGCGLHLVTPTAPLRPHPGAQLFPKPPDLTSAGLGSSTGVSKNSKNTVEQN